VWDGQNVLLETDGGGTTQAAYAQPADVYGALVSQRRGGATQQYHFDALGSTMELSNAAQTVTDTWRYQAFGETQARTGSSASPFGFVGELGYYQEAGLRLHYVRARWYDARVGRWVGEDPVQGGNLYVYVGGRATRGVDPSGRSGAHAALSPTMALPFSVWKVAFWPSLVMDAIPVQPGHTPSRHPSADEKSSRKSTRSSAVAVRRVNRARRAAVGMRGVSTALGSFAGPHGLWARRWSGSGSRCRRA
jgi:RHS repeat-associated protein